MPINQNQKYALDATETATTEAQMAKQSSNNILTVVFADVFFLDCHVGLCPPRNDETFPISANDNHIKVKNVA